MVIQIYDTHTENPMFTNSTFPVFPIVKIKLLVFLSRGIKSWMAGRNLPTLPTSERETPFHSGEFPDIHQNEASVNSLDAIFLEAMKRVQPSLPIHGMTQQEIFSALKTDSVMMDRFIKELLTHNDLEVPRRCRNRILKLVVNHPDTTAKTTPQTIIISLREGYQYPCDCDSSLPSFKPLFWSGRVIKRTINAFPHSFNFEGRDLLEETFMEDGQEIKRWNIPLTTEEAIKISERYRQKVE